MKEKVAVKKSENFQEKAWKSKFAMNFSRNSTHQIEIYAHEKLKSLFHKSKIKAFFLIMTMKLNFLNVKKKQEKMGK